MGENKFLHYKDKENIELILIAKNFKKEGDPKAIESAQLELSNRGISKDDLNIIFNSHIIEKNIYSKLKSKNEDEFSILKFRRFYYILPLSLFFILKYNKIINSKDSNSTDKALAGIGIIFSLFYAAMLIKLLLLLIFKIPF